MPGSSTGPYRTQRHRDGKVTIAAFEGNSQLPPVGLGNGGELGHPNSPEVLGLEA